MLVLFFLSSGLFLGWSLGANDASNIFGTAVGSRMVRFKTAALVASLFVILGAVVSGSGTTHTLGLLGSINRLAGSFVVALSAALAVFWMTRIRLPVSTSQAIVGAIIGWNLFAGRETDLGALTRIISSWVFGPLLAAVIALLLYQGLMILSRRIPLHLFRLDVYTRTGLILIAAFGAYSLGANNIANVMGVFIPANPFPTLQVVPGLEFNSSQQLFLIGGIAIASGIFTYSHKVIATVGERVVKLTPQGALVVVLAGALVLFLFASQGLEAWLKSHGWPTIPLVPMSSSQVIVGALVGIGLAHGGRHIDYRLLGKIASGWVTTPIIAGIISLLALFCMQNIFNQSVY